MKIKLTICFLLCFAAGWSQINIPNTTAVTQNFDGMGTGTGNITPVGIKVSATAANYSTASQAVTQTAGLTGAGALTTSATGGCYNFGNAVNATSTDRSLGFLTSGTSPWSSPKYTLAEIKNTGTDVISELTISFDYEKYRNGSNIVAMSFFHGSDATNVNTAATGGDAAYPSDGSVSTLSAPLTTSKSFTITGLSIIPNETYYLCWKYSANIYTSAQAIGIDNLSLTATFTPICSDPSVQASTIGVSNPTLTSADFSWANAAGSYGTMLVIRPTATANVLPTSGTNYVANSLYTSAAQISGTNNRVVYKGTGTSVTVTGLTANTQYTATIYSYNEPGRCYNTSSPESINFFTLTNEPTASPTTFTCTVISSSQINLSFTALPAAVKGYLITYRENALPTGLPADGTQYVPGTVIGDATVVAELTTASVSTLSVTGLNGGTVYYFSIFPFNGTVGSGATYNYKTTAVKSTGGCSTTTAPEINVKGDVNPTYPDILNNDFVTRSLDNTYAGTAAVGGSIAKTFRIQNIGNANLTVSSIVMAGTNPGDFVVSGLTFPLTITGSTFVTFTVTFSPSAGGLRSAIVQINNNDSDESLYQFAVEGTGNAAEIDVLGGGISIPTGSGIPDLSVVRQTQYGDVNYLSGSLAHTFTISNLGTLALTITTPVISGPNASDFSITSFPTSPLAAGSSTTLVITFDPASLGVKNATITIGNTDPNENPYTFAIQGTGTNYIFCALGAAATIVSQNFETTLPVPALGYSVSQDTGMSVPSAAGGQMLGDNRTTLTNAFIGARSFQAKGYSSSSSDPELTSTITFDTYDVSAYKEVSLNLKMGAYSTVIGTTVGLDTDDNVKIYLSTNGGTSWSHEMTIGGYSNAIWDINTDTRSVAIDADGDNVPVKFVPTPAATDNTVNGGPKDVTINNIPNSSQLKIKIVFSVNRSDEVWVIDDVKISGRKPATTTWTGSSWSAGDPNNTTKAIFEGSYNAGVNIEACSCEIKSPFVVNVAGGKYIEIQNDITNNGTINIANNGSLIQVNDFAVNSGVSNVTRTTALYDAFDYTYWSAPVFEPTIGASFPGMRTDYSYSFNTINFADLDNDGFDDAAPYAWTLEGPLTKMKAGVGYIVRAGSVAGTSNGTFGGILNNGFINVAASLSGNNADNTDDFNLVGNPYPSAISADTFIDVNTNTAGTLYFWTHVDNISPSNPGPDMYNYSADDYAVYTKVGGTGPLTRGAILHPGHPVSGVTSAPSGFIASGQGFFTDYNGPGPIVFTNAMRSKGYGNTDFFKQSEESKVDRIWLNLSNADNMFSQQLIGYLDDATFGYDRGYDGLLNNAGTYVNFYSLIDSGYYKVQGRPAFDISDIVPLGYFSSVEGLFEISIDKYEGKLDTIQNIYLEDKELNILHDLKQAPYSFSTARGTFNNRFVLKYTNETLGVNHPEGNQNQITVAVNEKIAVRSIDQPIESVTVYDLLGRTIFSKNNLNEREFTIDGLFAKQQSLIIRTVLQNGIVVNKKIIF